MRRFRQLFGSALLAALVLAIVAAPVGAGRSWCRTDPIVQLGNTQYQLIVAIPEENVPQVDGPMLFDIYSPAGIGKQLLFTDSGYNGHGEQIEFYEHKALGTHVFVLDMQQTGKDFPVMVEVYVDGKLVAVARGTSGVMRMPVPVINTGFENRGR